MEIGRWIKTAEKQYAGLEKNYKRKKIVEMVDLCF